MRKISTFLFLFLFSFTVFSQTTYNWVPQTVSPDNNLKKMINVNDTLTIVGLNNTFVRSTDKGLSWEPTKVIDAEHNFNTLSINSKGVGLLGSRRNTIINFKKGINDVYVDGKLMQTLDNGASWSIMDVSGIGFGGDTLLNPNDPGCVGKDFYTVECIDKNNALIYVSWIDMNSGSKVSKGAVYYTTDGGTIWTAITEDFGSKVINAIENKGNVNYIAGFSKLLKNTLGTKEVVDIFPNLVAANDEDDNVFIYDMEVLSETEFYLVTVSDGIFHTIDGGETFVKLGDGAPNGGNDIKVIDDNTIMVLGTSAKSKVTVDGGTTWTPCYPGASCWEIGGVFNDSVYALAKNAIYKIAVSDLATAPTNWVAQNLTDKGVNIQKMHIIDENNAIVIGYYEFAISTSDKGITWTDIDTPELFAAGTDDEYDITFSDINSSNGVSYAVANSFKVLDYPKESIHNDTYSPGLIYKSLDNWTTSSLMDIDEIGKENEDDVTVNPFNDSCISFKPNVIENITDSIIFVWANWNDTVAGADNKVTHSRVFRSKDSGKTWFAVTDDLGSPYVNEIFFADKDNGFVLGSKTLLKTTDGGDTFTNLYPIIDVDEDDNMFINGIDYINDNEYYITTSMDGIWKTLDGGTIFTKLEGIAGANDFSKLSDTRYLALGTTTKSKISKDLGETWENCFPGESVWSIGGVVNDSLYALTKGEVYKIALKELTTNVGINDNLVEDNNKINVLSRPYEFEVISSEQNIDICVVYNICGELIYKSEPKALNCIINHSKFSAGMYFVSTSINGKRYTNKIIVR
ncbi:MAG: T9SS type A sorting domain-containing protein [Bacteroidetes bacterium]|nr:T9SS type A sorting domain-containing protein [Bacteroidota bacterium]